MSLSYSDILITAAIIGLVLFAAVRAGQASPIGTGKIARRMNALELKVAAQGEKIDAIDSTVTGLAESQVKIGDVLGAVRIELASDRGLTERTWAAVDRLQQYFIQDAFDQRRKDNQ